MNMLFYDKNYSCARCGAIGLYQVEGGGGVSVYECQICDAPHTFIRQDDGSWFYVPETDDTDKLT